MKVKTIVLLVSTCVLTGNQCSEEPDPEPLPSTGSLVLSITYPEGVIINEVLVGFTPVPASGVHVGLFDENAICRGYKEAILGLVKVNGGFATWKYAQTSDESGIVWFSDIPAGKYYLLVVSGKRSTFSEKYIEIGARDTLELEKDFTPAAKFFEDMEPWDYEMEGYPYQGE